jgi:hypothetical protein
LDSELKFRDEVNQPAALRHALYEGVQLSRIDPQQEQEQQHGKQD